MSTTNTLPNGDVRQLIDQRLDAIDRALLGLLPRQDRLSIVSEVETRLRELAGASGANAAAEADETMRAEGTLVGERLRSARRSLSRLALSSGVLGIVALALLFALPITYLVVAYVGVLDEAAEVLLGTHVAAVALGGTLAVALSIAGLVSLQRGEGRMAGHGWAITGLCTGPLPMFVGGLIGLVVGLQLLAVQPGNVVQVTTTSAPVTVPAPAYSSAAQYAAFPPDPISVVPSEPIPNSPTVSQAPVPCPTLAYPTDTPGPVEPVNNEPANNEPRVAELPPQRVE